MSDRGDLFERNESTADPNGWMLTFADLISLIITFFVLLFASTSIKKPEWEQITRSLSQQLNPSKEEAVTTPAADISIEKEEAKPAEDLAYLYSILSNKIEATPYKDKLVIQQKDDRVVISIAGKESFFSGSTQMTPDLQAMVVVIGDIIRNLPNRIEIHGNADANPVSGKKFASNWELSLARALAVGEALRTQGYMNRFTIYGRGDSAYKDLPERLTAPQRERLSRRIDIIVRADRASLLP